MITAADDKIDELKGLVKTATKASCEAYIDIVVVGEMWGASDFSEEFKKKLRRLNELMIEANELMR